MESDCFRLAGGMVRVDWKNPGLRTALIPALEHRRTKPAAADLVITARTGGDFGKLAAGLCVEDTAEALVVDDGVHRQRHRLEAARTLGEYSCESAEAVPMFERAAPFRLLLQGWLRTRGVEILHAAAVATPEGAVLLAAPGGGGKSNTTLACVAGALAALGEDYIAVSPGSPPRVWSLYRSAKLHVRDQSLHPVVGAPRGEDGGKVLLFPPAFAAAAVDGVPLRGILVLRIGTGTKTFLESASPAEAVKAMLTSLLMVLPSARRPLFEFTARLAGAVPVRRLVLGRDRGEIAAVVKDHLLRLAA